MHIGGGARYNSDSRKGAALVCIYLIKDITEFRKSPVATCDGALFFNPKYK